MTPSLSEQAHQRAIKSVPPQQFTIGASIGADGKIRGVATYDRKWSNGWGATAYARAWWDDLAVTPHPKFEAGAEFTKKF